MANQATVDKILIQMCSSYPQKPVDGEEFAMLSQTWFEVLDDVSDALLELSAKMYLKSGATWRPAPGQLRTMALEISDGDAKTVAANAWFKIAESRYGRDAIDDPLVIKCVALLGGFDVIGNTSTENMHFVRDRFIEFYSELHTRESARSLMLGPGSNNNVKIMIGATAQLMRVK